MTTCLSLIETGLMENLTLNQFNKLKNEFVEFQINEMTTEDMVSYVRDILWTNVEKLTDVELEDEINEYDENLYEVLAPYVLDMEGSWETMQEFIHDRHANDWIEN